ncbi:OLC1v1015786C1 [Oldenlandia corymbosa var. corymbosa]|uniref:OLC1v1015786C1 n=1 Tax=Oldenlandia corymbosa var. corymbosa TaxID=529605 RepID=A0AAV1E6Z2_OLDCO|nr:OLC1v1015786C1 [Oldenlandia corymbosa var. corymbosa]
MATIFGRILRGIKHANKAVMKLRMAEKPVVKTIPTAAVYDGFLPVPVAEMLKHPDEVLPALKLAMAERRVAKQIPIAPSHWAFCHAMLPKVSKTFALHISQLGSDLRDVGCLYYLVLRAMDTVEDDMSLDAEVKVPIILAFHRHIYNPDWHFSCGTKDDKILMDQFRHVTTALLEQKSSYRDIFEEITKRGGAGIAKFVGKEIETIDDYEEYCHYATGIPGIGFSKLMYASGKEDLVPESLSNSWGMIVQKASGIRDYLEDINEVPKPRINWPREIWGKYASKFEVEDLKYEENSAMAVQCLNEMVTNALIHIEDCLKFLSTLRSPAAFRFFAITAIVSMGRLATYYNNVEVFRGKVEMRQGLTAKVFDNTKSMEDVYGVFYDFASLLMSKIEDNDPNAKDTRSKVKVILNACKDSGALNKRTWLF